jgi:hypothetical protein
MLHFAVGEYKFHSARCKFSEAETTRIRTRNRITITSRVRSRSRRRRRSSSTFQKKTTSKIINLPNWRKQECNAILRSWHREEKQTHEAKERDLQCTCLWGLEEEEEE